MSGWNIVYGLINFAILAAALFFIGRKIVSRGYRDHREKVEKMLSQAEETAREAKDVLAAIPEAEASGERACGEILDAARAAAEENSRLAREKDSAAASQFAAENDRALDLTRAELRRTLGAETAESISGAAAALLAQERFAPQRAALCGRQIDGFAASYRPYPGELESFAVQGRARISVCFAEKPSDDAAERVARAVVDGIRRACGREIPAELNVSIDPALIGGVRIEVGDTVFDGSLAGQLRRAKDALAAPGEGEPAKER